MEKIEGKEFEKVIEVLGEDVFDELLAVMKTCETSEEFYNRVMIGPCPVCNGEKTRDCEGTKIDDTTVGVCMECGTSWCLECKSILETWPCRHWEICDGCAFMNEDKTECTALEDLNYEICNCSILKEKLASDV